MCPPFRHGYRLLAVSLAVTLMFGSVRADEDAAKVKAAVVFNFFRFIEWPAEAANREKLILCTDSEHEVGMALQALEGKAVDGRVLQVRLKVAPEAMHACHIVYMEEPKASVLRDLRSYPVVSVGNGSGFIEQGGMIALVADGEHLGFEINQELALSNGVKISALVLKLARSVRSGF